MPSSAIHIAAAGAVLAMIAALPAAACPAGAKCLTVPDSMKTAPQVTRTAYVPTAPAAQEPPLAVGDVIAEDQVQVLLNTAYHGLPPSDGSFWYVRNGGHIYRMNPATLEVLGMVD